MPKTVDPATTFRALEKATKGILAAGLSYDGQPCGRIVFIRSRSNLRVTCYLHVQGAPMARAHAFGGGYDKHTAAAVKAAAALAPKAFPSPAYDALKAALAEDGGKRWADYLHAAGFQVHEVL